MAPTASDSPDKQLWKQSISPDQRGYIPHLPTGDDSSLNCPIATMMSGVPDCLPCGNPVI